mmetsp:Transcript_28146/g.36401  ORF Transcript_28146/g.36401 Transcript_28146/m.36401 type:complete len:870 (+) Transcript_28146:28-2637(+)
MRYNRTKASRLIYTICMFFLVVGYPLWLKMMTILPVVKYSADTPYSSSRHISFVHDGISPFGNSEMCDQCDGVSDAIRYPISVKVDNFTDLDQAAYVVVYVSQDYKGKWYQPGYPAILSAVTAVNESIDLCSVPQQFTHAPSLIPTPKPTKESDKDPSPTPAPAVARRKVLNSFEEEEDLEEEVENEEPVRRLHTPEGKAGDLDDDFAQDDLSAAQLGCCIGSPGQMYMVACVVRDWPGTSNIGKSVPGPPFDDRCVTMSGVCGVTCGASVQDPKSHCEDGIIPQRYLVADYCGDSNDDNDGSHNCGEDVKRVDDDYYQEQKELKKEEKRYFKLLWWLKGNYGWFQWADIITEQPVWHWMFMTMMFMAYTSMVLAYVPGIGRCGSSRARLPILHTLNSQGAIKDGVECISFSISASEHKLWVLRNLVGKCASSFYHPQALLTDYFQDETARSGAYAIWDALSRFVDKDESCQVDMVGFLKAWAARLRDPAELLQETEDRFKTRSTEKRLLSDIESCVDPFHNIGSLAIKYGLTEDDLAELHYAYELYELIDCMLDKRVWTGWDVTHQHDESPSDIEPGVYLYEWEEGYDPRDALNRGGSSISRGSSGYVHSNSFSSVKQPVIPEPRSSQHQQIGMVESYLPNSGTSTTQPWGQQQQLLPDVSNPIHSSSSQTGGGVGGGEEEEEEEGGGDQLDEMPSMIPPLLRQTTGGGVHGDGSNDAIPSSEMATTVTDSNEIDLGLLMPLDMEKNSEKNNENDDDDANNDDKDVPYSDDRNMMMESISFGDDTSTASAFFDAPPPMEDAPALLSATSIEEMPSDDEGGGGFTQEEEADAEQEGGQGETNSITIEAEEGETEDREVSKDIVPEEEEE